MICTEHVTKSVTRNVNIFYHGKDFIEKHQLTVPKSIRVKASEKNKKTRRVRKGKSKHQNIERSKGENQQNKRFLKQRGFMDNDMSEAFQREYLIASKKQNFKRKIERREQRKRESDSRNERACIKRGMADAMNFSE